MKFSKLLPLTLTFLAALVYSCSAHSLKPDPKVRQHLNLINGYATECMMDRFLRYRDNWQRVDGEHGRNGIDGLYIKQKNHTIHALLVAESKYNRSRLGFTRKGNVRQMSKRWVAAKIATLKRYHEQPLNYNRLLHLVETGNYRARLFHLKPHTDNTLTIRLYDIRSDDNSVQKVPTSRIEIDFSSPKNRFEKDMIDTYNRCRRKSIRKWFPYLDNRAISQMLTHVITRLPHD